MVWRDAGVHGYCGAAGMQVPEVRREGCRIVRLQRCEGFGLHALGVKGRKRLPEYHAAPHRNTQYLQYFNTHRK